ncbi:MULTISPECIES: antibiotic biosynthesis monooxygenase family protein [Thermomonospora]|uniref:Heme-degrading monooxygenase HmoA n=1 Tax=Thermomonospora cellulosilytica TaxID=1411118 RepID=A0A7W3N123_9ACTN|nr:MULTISPECIES: antibiotic biosynthesis monooxygenase [Thermomonospora]MBA9005524.1 heme-degrading monooxygenase HmoA [Thermomonospora cellulosilytica]
MSRLRVLLYATAPEDDPGAVERAYHEISKALAGTPGLLGNELLGSTTEPGSFIVMSEWESPEAFTAWEQGAGHRGTTAPLRPYQDRRRGSPFGIYDVVASY